MRPYCMSKKEKARHKILEAQVKLVRPSKDGKEQSETYTVAGLINRYAEVSRSLTAVIDFTTEMAVELYKVNPDHPFIKKSGTEFAEFVKRAEDRISTQASIKSIEEALRASQEGGADGAVQVQDQTVPASA